LRTEVKIEEIKEYLKLADEKSYEKLQEESKKDKGKRNKNSSIKVKYWFDRWQSYKDLKSKMPLKSEGGLPLGLLKIEDFLKFVETSINSLNENKDSYVRNGRLDSYLDIKYMILGKEDDRENLRLDKKRKSSRPLA
jgi:hypothetical protein